MIAISFFSFCIAYAQTGGRTSTDKFQKSQSPVVAEVPAGQPLVTADPRTVKRPMIISTEPAPKADPAREVLAQRKQEKVKIEVPRPN